MIAMQKELQRQTALADTRLTAPPRWTRPSLRSVIGLLRHDEKGRESTRARVPTSLPQARPAAPTARQDGSVAVKETGLGLNSLPRTRFATSMPERFA